MPLLYQLTKVDSEENDELYLQVLERAVGALGFPVASQSKKKQSQKKVNVEQRQMVYADEEKLEAEPIEVDLDELKTGLEFLRTSEIITQEQFTGFFKLASTSKKHAHIMNKLVDSNLNKIIGDLNEKVSQLESM